MDLEMLIQKFSNVSREELEKIRETTHYYGLCETVCEGMVCMLHDRRENEKINGRDSIMAGPLIHVLSVRIVPEKTDHEEPVTIYGRIYSKFCDTTSGKTIVHDLYSRRSDDAEVLGPSGSLTLTNLDCSSWPLISMPFHNTRIVVDVCVGGKTLFARDICCVEDMTDFEQVKLEYVRTELGVLALRYIAMPFAVYGHVEVKFFHKQCCKVDEGNDRFLNVKGKVVARYGNTYGGCDSVECTLFEKQSNEFQRVGFGLRTRSMGLSRCWVGLPVYSSLIVDMDLLEFGSERKILKETVEFRVENKLESYAEFIVDDVLIKVGVRWVSPEPQGRHSVKECGTGMELQDESSDEEMSLQETSKDDSDDEQMNESCVRGASTNLKRPWQLCAHRSMPFSCPAVQIFSIFIGGEKFKALQVYGRVEVSCVDGRTFYAFNREAKDAAFVSLEESKTTLPVLNGCLFYDDCDSLKMKIELKDVESRLHIRGYIDWDCRTLEFGTPWLNKQLCSVVEGERHGYFAAIHYSIFPEAVQANIVGVLYTPKSGKSGNVSALKVCGSIVAQYNNFDYASRYVRDYYRVVLLQAKSEDPAQTSVDGAILLSRSTVVVPLNSSLVIEVSLWIGDDDDQVLLRFNTEARIGTNDLTVENNDYSLHFYLKWGEDSCN